VSKAKAYMVLAWASEGQLSGVRAGAAWAPQKHWCALHSAALFVCVLQAVQAGGKHP